MQRDRPGTHRGFTFAELALVLVFVTGLLIIASVSVRNIKRDTSTSNCQTELRTLKLATERYHSESTTYPIDKSVLVEGGLVSTAEVANWTIEFEGPYRAPIYRAVDDCA